MVADRGVLVGRRLPPNESLQFLSRSFKPRQGPIAGLCVHPALSPATAPPLRAVWCLCFWAGLVGFSLPQAQLIAQSIGQAFSVAYQEFLRANGINPEDLSQKEYSDIINTQEMYNDDLIHFSNSENCKEVSHMHRGWATGCHAAVASATHAERSQSRSLPAMPQGSFL